MLLACMPAAACSYQYRIAAIERAGAIVFEPDGAQGTGCLSDLTVHARNGAAVWAVRAAGYRAPPCVSRFPLTYGVTPTGMSERVKAAPLRPGTVYVVEAWDGDSYSGSFRLDRRIVVENLPDRRSRE